MAKQKSTHLYVLSCGTRLKIGVTNNIEQRLQSLTTGNPDPILVEYIEPRYNPHKAEKYLHNSFSKYKVRGEWFEGITIDQIKSKLMMFHDQDSEPNATTIKITTPLF